VTQLGFNDDRRRSHRPFLHRTCGVQHWGSGCGRRGRREVRADCFRNGPGLGRGNLNPDGVDHRNIIRGYDQRYDRDWGIAMRSAVHGREHVPGAWNELLYGLSPMARPTMSVAWRGIRKLRDR